MKTILVVEDDENKRSRIFDFLNSTYSNTRILSANSLHSGVSVALDDRPDLVLLDMTLPNYDIGPDETGGQHHIFGGQEFIRQMERFKVDTNIIVITQFETFGKAPNIINIEQLDLILKEESPQSYIGIVYYHASIEIWKTKLKEISDKILFDYEC